MGVWNKFMYKFIEIAWKNWQLEGTSFDSGAIAYLVNLCDIAKGKTKV